MNPQCGFLMSTRDAAQMSRQLGLIKRKEHKALLRFLDQMPRLKMGETRKLSPPESLFPVLQTVWMLNLAPQTMTLH